jgi:signal transduction histidine kinase
MKWLGKIINGARAVRSQVEDILLFNKGMHNAIELNEERYDLAEQLAQIAEGYRYHAAEKGMRIVLQADGPVFINADKKKMETTVFGNLLSNARKFGKKTITIEMKRTAEMAVVSISDDGDGMKGEIREKVFSGKEMITTDLINGNGFGLTNAKRIIDLHSGSIGLESEIGKGSTFVVTLPLAL